jgi:hypothetical protein
MAIKLTDQDHKAMDEFLGFVLDAYASGEVTRLQAIATLAHVLTAAAIDNHSEVLAWFNQEQYERWKEDAKAAR